MGNYYRKFGNFFAPNSIAIPLTGFAYVVRIANDGDTYKVPANNLGVYNAPIDFGDGNSFTCTAYNDAELTHTYTLAGDYTIHIQGDFPYFTYISGGDVLKHVETLQFGTWKPESLLYFLWGATNNVASWTDTIDVTNLGGDVTRAFNNAGNGGNLSPFPAGFQITAGVRLMQNCQADWDLSTLDYTGFGSFQLAASGNNAFSTANYDKLLLKMDADGVSGDPIDWNQTEYTIATSGAARANLITAGCTITDAGGI
jgi:hypothetical protein